MKKRMGNNPILNQKSTNGRAIIASPQSTGGEGFDFENHVQSLFAVLMLCDGEIPILPNRRIVEIAMQTADRGFHLDDVLVEFKDNAGGRFRLLGQIKETISLTRSCQDFKETLQNAWKDFIQCETTNEPSVAFALITGPLNRKDTGKINWLLNQARTRSASEFEEKMESGLAVSCENRKFYKMICEILAEMGGCQPDANQLHAFLRKFHIMQPDIWSPGGMTEAFSLSLIKRQFKDAASIGIWSEIKKIVHQHNSSGGTIDRSRLLALVQSELGIGVLEKAQANVPKIEGTSVPIKSRLSGLVQQHPSIRSDRLALLSLVGSWRLQQADDQATLCQILGMNSDAVDDLLHEIGAYAPWFFRIEGGLAILGQRQSLWQATASALSHHDIERFLEIVQIQLPLLDRRLEQQAEDPWMSMPGDAGFGISPQLREGIAHGLALLGAESGYCTQVDVSTRENWTRLAVRKCLSGTDWRTWASLDGLLPLLAEAAPDEYLACTRVFLARKKDGLETLLQEREGFIVPVSHSTGFVGALGLLAWLPDYFSGAIDLLCQVASRDKGGRCGPRAESILQSILHPLHPHTLVESSRRLNIFRNLVERKYKRWLWNVILGLLPCGSCVLPTGVAPPLYRDVGTMSPPDAVANKKEEEQFDAYAFLALKLCVSDAGRVIALVQRIEYFTQKVFLDFVTRAEKLAGKFRGEARYRIWVALQDQCRHIAMLSGRKAIFPANDEEQKLQNLTRLYEPKEAQFRFRPLFSYMADGFAIEKTPEQEARETELQTQRTVAVMEVYKQTGTSGVLDFAKHVEKSWEVGFLFGQHAEINIDKELLPGKLNFRQDENYGVISGFVAGRFSIRGWEWVVSVIDKDWNSCQKAMLLVLLPFGHDVWQRLPDLLRGDVDLYWKNVRTCRFVRRDDLAEAVEGLLSAGCGFAAIDLLAREKVLNNAWNLDLCLKVLDSFADGNVTDSQFHDTIYHLTRLFRQLQKEQKVSAEKMERYEWMFFEVFEQFGEFSKNKIHPLALERKLASEPDFFCEALRTAYLPETKTGSKKKKEGGENSLSPSEKIMARRMWFLLHNWSVLPGVRSDGQFDGNEFSRWVKKAFRQVRKDSRLIVAQSVLGQAVFRGAPPSDDGFWMPHEIAAFMEKDGNSKVLHAYGIAVSNSRGIHFEDPTMKTDRALAEKYTKQAEQAEEYGYIGLAQVMRKQAELVLAHARQNKEERALMMATLNAHRKSD